MLHQLICTVPMHSAAVWGPAASRLLAPQQLAPHCHRDMGAAASRLLADQLDQGKGLSKQPYLQAGTRAAG